MVAPAAMRGVLTKSDMLEVRLRVAVGVEVGEEGTEVDCSKYPLSMLCSIAPSEADCLVNTGLLPSSLGLHVARWSLQDATCTGQVMRQHMLNTCYTV